MTTREEALEEFRRSRIGARGVNPETVFLQGWDARQAELDKVAPKWFPATRDLRSSGWSGGPIV